MNRVYLPLIALLLAITGTSLAIQQIENPDLLPASSPAFESIRGVTSNTVLLWKPVTEQGNRTIWNSYPSKNAGYISIAYGKPIAFASPKLDKSYLARLAIEFTLANSDEFGTNNYTPVVSTINNRGKNTVIDVRFSIDDIPIESSSLILVINQSGNLISVKVDGYGGEPTGSFTISKTRANEYARKAFDRECEVARTEAIWMPRVGKTNGITLEAAYKVDLTAKNHPSFRPRLYLNAETGEVLASENMIRSIEVQGEATGTVFPLYGRDEPERFTFPYEEINIENNSIFTDADGQFTTDQNEDNAPFHVSGVLNGHWVEVHEFEVNDAAFSSDFEIDQFAGVDWTDDNSSPDERNLYFHVNVVHDYYKTIEPDFDGMDFVVRAFCGVGGAGYQQLEDNAFSTGPELYFGRGRQADNFAHYCDVIYHEYGHSVTGAVYGNHALPYQGESGAMNEGWSDYFACSFTDEPLMGEGGLLGNNYIRNVDNNLMYPRDINGEVHDDSRIFSAALWHTRQILGAQYCDSLFHFTRYLYANDFREYFLDVLISDDDDGDITNGSPNYRTIYEQFARHGIGLEDVSHFQIAHSALTDIGDDGGEGADNGFYEPGETVEIMVDVFRAGAPVPQNQDSVYVQLETDSPSINVRRGRVYIGQLAPGDIGSTPQPLEFTISVDAPLEFANIYLVAGASAGETPVVDTVRIPLGHPSILLVRDGNRETDRSFYYHRALERLDSIYYDIALPAPAHPLDQMISSFQTVIWFTGDEKTDVMTENSRLALESYLDNGGHLIISGQYLPDWDGAGNFLENRMGARFVSDSLNLTYLEGVEGDPLGDGQTFLLLGGEGARNQGRPAAIEPVNNAIASHLWSRVENSPVAAVRREDPDNNSKTIFFAFGLEAIGGAGRTSTMDQLLRRSFDWFAGRLAIVDPTPSPTTTSLSAAYPNPFNGTTVITYSLSSAQEIELGIYDISGRLVAELEHKYASAGEKTISWRAENTPAGLYLIRLTTSSDIRQQSVLLLK